METDFRDSGYVPVIYFYRLPYLSLSQMVIVIGNALVFFVNFQA